MLAACAPHSASRPYPHPSSVSPSPLSPAELQHLLRQPAQRHAPLVIDVRPLRQYSRGHIPGSQHSSRALLLSSELPDQDLVLITEDDQRAEELGAALHQRGYHRQIRSLHGGLSAWTQAGHPLQQAPACNTSSGFASRALAPLGLPPLALAALAMASVILALLHVPLPWLATAWAMLLLGPRLQALRAGRTPEIPRQRVA
jgi:rhodanese-related sulfurtransferase